MNAGRARAPSIAALALLLAAPAGAADDGAARIRSLTTEFVARRLARPPHLARRGGEQASVPLAPTLTVGALAAERAWLADFRARLDAERAGTPLGARDLLEAALEHDALELEVLRPFERDPGAYIPLVAGAVEAALLRPGASSCAAARDAARRLAEVPDVLRAARLNLKNPPRILVELAIDRYADVLRFYREDVPRTTAGCRSARMQADLAQADTTAVRAVEAFLRYLAENLLPASNGALALGPDGCRRMVGSALMAEVASAESLLAESARLVEARRAELDSAAARLSTADLRAALDALASGGPGAAGRLEATEQAVDRVLAFLRERELVALPSKLALRARPASAFREPRPLRLAVEDPDVPRGKVAWLEFASSDSPPGPGRWVSDLAVACEGLPGRLIRELPARNTGPRPERGLSDVWPGEDWGELAERILLDEGYGAGDPRYRLAMAARALRRAGRSLAALGLHSGTMSPEDVRRMLEEQCLLEPAEAERETRWAAADPGSMGYTVGAQRWLELRDDARQRLGSRYRTRAFFDAVLRCGVAPYGFVRERLMHELAASGSEPVGAKP